jgi:uncharacterized protein
MPTRVFVDTSYVIALINPRDQYHEEAIRLAKSFIGQPILITDAVLLEVGNMLARNYRAEAARAINSFLSASEVEVVHLHKALLQRALSFYEQHQDKAWGLVDCISFIVMRDADISKALAFDQHFVQAGFEILQEA